MGGLKVAARFGCTDTGLHRAESGVSLGRRRAVRGGRGAAAAAGQVRGPRPAGGLG